MLTRMNGLLLSFALAALAGCSVAPTCTTGTIPCGSVCVETERDNLNCGACGNICGVGTVCSSGACAVSCQGSQVACGGACVDPQTSPTFCGATGTCTGTQAGSSCASGQTCQGGACACLTAGQVACGGACIDPRTSATHCGASGDCTGTAAGTTCASGQTCQSGTCVNVAAPRMTTIAVTPNPVPSLAPGATTQLTVTGSYDFGPTRDLTSAASYSASPGGIVAFSSGGLVTAVSAGTATITAAVTPTGAGTVSGTTSVTVTAAQTGYDPGAGWTLVWSDEFNGTAVDQTNWTFDIGAGGWGNNESEYYRAENAVVAGGALTITARKEPFGDAPYTSARLQTSRKRAFTYGKFTMGARLPYSQAMWPAFWMLGVNSNSFNLYGGDVTWPACGEADIMEMIGGLADGSGDYTTHGTLHYLNGVGRNPAPSYAFRAPSRLADDFHVYEMVWTPHSFTWKFDGLAIGTKLIDPDMEEFSKPMFLLLNLAVGGAWGGWVDGSTVFPQDYVIDYVRVYTNDSCLPGGAANLASYWHLSSVAASGVSSVAESLSSSPGTIGGFQPLKTLTGPAVWYGPALTGSFEEGAWSIGIFTTSPGAPARVRAELFVTAADGSGAASLGAAQVDVNATGGGNHRSWFTLTGVPAVHLAGQRLKLVLAPVSGTSATMIYNGTDFDSVITAPFSPR